MQGNSTVAFPYATALFNLAQKDNSFGTWQDLLSKLTGYLNEYHLVILLANPKLSKTQVFDFLIQLLNIKDNTTQQQLINFIELIVNNNRLSQIADIYHIYLAKVRQYRGEASATIKTAFALDNEQQLQLQKYLSIKYNKQFSLNIVVEPELIGGIKILIDDQQLDLSIAGKIKQLEMLL